MLDGWEVHVHTIVPSLPHLRAHPSLCFAKETITYQLNNNNNSPSKLVGGRLSQSLGITYNAIFVLIMSFRMRHMWRGSVITLLSLKRCLHRGPWSHPHACKFVIGWTHPGMTSVYTKENKIKCQSDHGVWGPQKTNFKAYIIHDTVQRVLRWERQKRCFGRKGKGPWHKTFLQ